MHGLEEALRDSTPPIEGTLVERYLREQRGLDPVAEDRKILHHPPDARGNEDAMLVEVSDADGKLVAVQLTYLTQSGEKSTIEPVRMTLRLVDLPELLFDMDYPGHYIQALPPRARRSRGALRAAPMRNSLPSADGSFD
jgi:hypothetical protein